MKYNTEIIISHKAFIFNSYLYIYKTESMSLSVDRFLRTWYNGAYRPEE